MGLIPPIDMIWLKHGSENILKSPDIIDNICLAMVLYDSDEEIIKGRNRNQEILFVIF